jgi:hypothetical protein
MSTLETWLINFALSIILSTIKNPAHAAEVQAQLIGIANDIYAAYGLTPPTTTPVPATRRIG